LAISRSDFFQAKVKKSVIEKELLEINNKLCEIAQRYPQPVGPRMEPISKILTPELSRKLLKMLQPGFRRWKLLVTSESGTSSDVFDRAVAGKKNILVLIHSTNDFKFGAFVADTFGGSTNPGWIQGSPDTFIFTFRDDGIPIKLSYSGTGITGHFSSCGLHLGNSMSELCAFCSHQSTGFSAFQLAEGYSLGGNQMGGNLLAGTSNFTPKFMEVYEHVH